MNRVRCTDDVIYMDNLIIRPEARGLGIGRHVWNAVVEASRPGNIVLDGVQAMVPWYRKQGFTHSGMDVTTYSFRVTGSIKKPVQCGVSVIDLCDSHWPGVLTLDRTVYPTLDRERVLRAFMVGNDVRTVVADDGREVVGIGSVHKKTEGLYGLRNVIATNEQVAEAIVRELLVGLPQESKVLFRVPVGKKPMELLGGAEQGSLNTRLHSDKTIEICTDNLWMALCNIV